MKARHFVYSLLILMLVFGACRDITVKTKVNKDGSFTRIITVSSSDTSYAYSMDDLPYLVDNSWAKEVKTDTTDQNTYIVIYSKSFKNDDELNVGIVNDTGWMKDLNRKVEVSKRFQFFYTYLTFRQGFSVKKPMLYLDTQDFLSHEEILMFSGHRALNNAKDSAMWDSAEIKALDYFVTCAVAEIESELITGIKKLNIPELSADIVSIYHDSISAAINGTKIDTVGQIIDKYVEWSGNEKLVKLKEIEPPLFSVLNEKVMIFERILGMEQYTQVVEMPGLITRTNSPNLKGNEASWGFKPVAMMFDGYEMYVESRVVNTWAFIISGLVLLSLVILIVIKATK